jgi:SAM-dependent methyltransferase
MPDTSKSSSTKPTSFQHRIKSSLFRSRSNYRLANKIAAVRRTGLQGQSYDERARKRYQVMEPRKAVIRDYWQAQPCGTTLTNAPAGSREFFAEIEKRRYQVEPFVRDFATFDSWRERSVLEVGTGTGTDFVNFCRAGARAVGVDITSAAIELVRQRLALEGRSAATLVADVESLPFADDSFDLVYSWGVLHHTTNTERGIAEIHRILRRPGEARLMLYSRRSWVALGLWLRYALARGNPLRTPSDVLSRHLESPGTKAYTDGEIRAMLSRFDDVHLERFVTPYDRRVAGPLASLIPAGFFVGVIANKR